MTVDLDLLADYVEGLLEPDEQARVQSLVQHDPDWASAHAALQAALPSVATALASVTPEPMPASVLAATLRSFAAERAAMASTAGPDHAVGHPHKRDTTRPASGRPPTFSAKRIRRREARTLALSALVLVFMVTIGLGYVIRNNANRAEDSKSASGGANVAPQFAGGGTSHAGSPLIVASGTDYTQLTLPLAYAAENASGPSSSVRTPDSLVPGPKFTSAALARLASPDALNECLTEVSSTAGGTPTLVDYARFQGTPALVMTFLAPKMVLAVGADCGLPGHGIDELARS